jgi:two-component system, cell cycle sensor histidine kinase and response regulator CckA
MYKPLNALSTLLMRFVTTLTLKKESAGCIMTTPTPSSLPMIRRDAWIVFIGWSFCIIASLFWNLHYSKPMMSVLGHLVFWFMGNLGIGTAVQYLSRRVMEQEKIEQSLVESNAKNCTLLDALPDQIFHLSRQGICLDYNAPKSLPPGIHPNSILNPENIIGKSLNAFLTAEVATLFQENIIKTLDTGQSQTFECKINISNPPEYFETYMGVSTLNAVIAVMRNITRRKQAEMDLYDVAARLHATVEQTPMGFTHALLDGHYVFVNHRFCNMLGYTEQELLQRTYQSITHPDDLNLDLELVQKIMTEEIQNYSLEKRYIRKDGSFVWTNISVILLRDHANNPSYFIAVIEDISQRKQVEIEHTALQQQLLQSQKMESVGRLAGGVAHDFNNLLSVILGYSEMLLLDTNSLNHFAQESLHEIQKAGDRAKILTKQLLAFGRKQILEIKIIDLNLIIPDIEKMLKRLIGEDVEVITQLAPTLGMIKVDSDQMEQILLNLAVNARDAMPEGGKLIIETNNLEIVQESDNITDSIPVGQYVTLTVTDTGCGMDEETLTHLFEPFYTTKDRGRGSGLGLATVYGIVKQHGGEIVVQSELGKGSSFRIYLPRCFESTLVEKSSEDIDDATLKGDETLLVVEDDVSLRQMVCHVLHSRGYRVLEAIDVKDALHLASEKRDKINLILSDVIMPELNGPALVEKMQAFCPNAKVIYMSGYSDETIAHHGILEEGYVFIQKPFTLEGLLKKIRQTLTV